MTINWKLWNKPETGGLIGALVVFIGFCFLILAKTVLHYKTTQEEIAFITSKISSLSTQIDIVEAYEKLSQQEAQKFNIFKRKKWDQALTQEHLNNSIYALQKQANVEFLFIQPKSSSDTNNITKTEISLVVQVLRDQSFFNFIQKLETELPGIVKIKKFELKRANTLNPQLAQKVSEGEKVSLFEGIVDLELEYCQFNGTSPASKL